MIEHGRTVDLDNVSAVDFSMVKSLTEFWAVVCQLSIVFMSGSFAPIFDCPSAACLSSFAT